ncbi:MAG: MFS transporter [Candidatus Limnocylindrales bacterium]|jgi:MFS family permease
MISALGVFLGLVLGLAVGGSVENLLDVRLRWLPALLVAAGARISLDWALAAGSVPEPVRMWLVLVTYVLLAAMLLANRGLPGMTAAALGTAANGIAIVVNGGWMPVWQPSLGAAGLDPNTLNSSFHTLLTGPMNAAFFAHGGPLADVIPIPIPIIQSVASVGDLLLGAGLAFFIFAAVVRAPVLVSVPLAPAFAPGAAIEGEGALSNPYVRLATNGAFSAMWLSQVVSSLGDRVHQIALVFLVARATNASPLALGLVFAAMTIPTFLVGPVAGALVDRWDRKRVMVGSDLVRAGLVFAIPVVSGLYLGLVFGLVFLVAVASSFFRPARVAALPQVVPERDLLTANSAMSIADNVTDMAGYGLGGLFVAFLGSALPLAFWIDGASYLASASLVAAATIPRISLARGAAVRRPSLRTELASGWRFLRAETVLFATTVQAAIAEYGLGALTALSPLLIAALPLGRLDAPTAYGFFEMSMSVGLLGGGVVIGTLALRIAKGPAIVAGFAALGFALLALAMTGALWVALVLAAIVGLANVTFVVPSQTIFQQRTPAEMLGRVVAIRLALVNAMLAASMVTSSLFAQIFGLHVVLAACGILATATGLAGLGIRAIRDA